MVDILSNTLQATDVLFIETDQVSLASSPRSACARVLELRGAVVPKLPTASAPGGADAGSAPMRRGEEEGD